MTEASILYFLIQCLMLFSNIFALINVKIYLTHAINDEICKPDVNMAKRHIWMYLTNWNFLFIQLFLVYSITATLILKLCPSLKRKCDLVRSFFFLSIVYPGTIYIMVMFWSLYHYNRELVYPSKLDFCLPPYFNHLVHTFIALPLVLEIIFTKIVLIDFKTIFGTSLLYGITYATVFFYAYFAHGVCVYALFDVIGWKLKIFLLLIPIVIAFPAMKILYRLEAYKQKIWKSKYA